MAEYSAFSLLANALKGNKDWKPAWRKPDPKASYDVIIIGGGGHGLATAYYLAKEHGITNVAVLEKGWLGSGNVGRNTTAVRSNYLLPANTRFYEHSMKLWEGLSHELNYNVMGPVIGPLKGTHFWMFCEHFIRRAAGLGSAGSAKDPARYERMYSAGLWYRPMIYGLSGETIEQAYVREAKATRESAGIVDVSTLGKIAVQGPDAAAFLDRVYTNMQMNTE